jgi:hypothetical protein
LCEKVLLNTKEIVKKIFTPAHRLHMGNQLLVVDYAGIRVQTDIAVGMGAATIALFCKTCA